MNIYLGIICVDMVDFCRPGQKFHCFKTPTIKLLENLICLYLNHIRAHTYIVEKNPYKFKHKICLDGLVILSRDSDEWL